MFRSVLAAALRHLFRSKLYAAIAVSGLAVGLCAALLAALYIRSEYSYEHFLAGYQDVYQVTSAGIFSDRPNAYTGDSPFWLAAILKQRFPEVASVSRMLSGTVPLRVGDIEYIQDLATVDPDFFDILPFAAVAGDPAAALAEPDKLVITHAVARQYFGADQPLGRAVEIMNRNGRQVATVGAVIEDIPDNRSTVRSRVFVSSRSAWTNIYRVDTKLSFPEMVKTFGLSTGVRTLVAMRHGAAAQSVRKRLPELVSEVKEIEGGQSHGLEVADRDELRLVRIDRLHTDPDLNPGFTGRIAMAVILALVTLVIAAVNFVNLLTARSGTRVLEVGVRKLAGAGRGTLALQFLGEAFAYVMVAVVAAVAMTELLLPHVNAFLVADAQFEYWKEPALLGWILLGTIGFGLFAGFWPALVLSALRPLGAMHGARLARGGGGFFRQFLVSLQFALLTGLILTAGVVYLQRHYATEQAMRFDTDQVLILQMRCTPARMAELRRLAGVHDAACSGSELLGGGTTTGGAPLRMRDGRTIRMDVVAIDHRMLGLYGVQPIAGHGPTAAESDANSRIFLINESAVKAFGFDSAVAALGLSPLAHSPYIPEGLEQIIGVVPDFSMGTVSARIVPTLFHARPDSFTTISVRLKGPDTPGTLATIDRVWKDTGGQGPLNRMFYEERVERMYQSLLREARAFGIMSLVAVSLALLGLLGLAASAAEHRTKEIGVRRALGATTGDVLRLLLWQFSKPVIWANLLIWPLAGWAMQRWLSGFAYRIDPPLWLFPATALAVLLVALATVSAQALAVARSKPVTALRHE